jgi:hypothetical protein
MVQHARHRAQRVVEVVDVHQRHVADHTVVRGTVPPVHARGVAVHVADSDRMPPLDVSGSLEQLAGEVDCRHRRTASGERVAQLAPPTPKIQHA